MTVDTSIVVAIVRKELGFEKYLQAILQADRALISSVNLLECYFVLGSKYELVARLVEDAGIVIWNFTASTAELGRAAFLKYGKGRHRAVLNICDCAAYATARESGEPLLFKGEDFKHTDVPKYEPVSV